MAKKKSDITSYAVKQEKRANIIYLVLSFALFIPGVVYFVSHMDPWRLALAPNDVVYIKMDQLFGLLFLLNILFVWMMTSFYVAFHVFYAIPFLRRMKETRNEGKNSQKYKADKKFLSSCLKLFIWPVLVSGLLSCYSYTAFTADSLIQSSVFSGVKTYKAADVRAVYKEIGVFSPNKGSDYVSFDYTIAFKDYNDIDIIPENLRYFKNKYPAFAQTLTAFEDAAEFVEVKHSEEGLRMLSKDYDAAWQDFWLDLMDERKG